MRPESSHLCPREAFSFYDMIGAKVAYLEDEDRRGRITARAVIYGKSYSRIYAADDNLAKTFGAALQRAGYAEIPEGREFRWPAEQLRGYTGPVPYVDWLKLYDDGELYLAVKSDDRCVSDLTNTHGGNEFDVGPLCYRCDTQLIEEGLEGPNGEPYCRDCFGELFRFCERCDNVVSVDDIVLVDDERWCERCADNHASLCDRCGGYTTEDLISVDEEGEWCEHCVERFAHQCEECDGYFPELMDVQGRDLCRGCMDDLDVQTCAHCGELYEGSELSQFRRWSRAVRVCSYCLPSSQQCSSCGCHTLSLDQHCRCAECARQEVAI